jgi:hypothetical protein
MELNLSNLGLKKLPNIPEGITILKCDNNEISLIDNLPNSLIELYCSNNKIRKLENLPKNLIKLECKNNYLTHLYLPPSVKIVSSKYQKSLEKNRKVSNMFLEPILDYIFNPKNMDDKNIEMDIEELNFM